MPTTSSAAPQPSVDPNAFSVTSPDFADGEELADIHTADAFSGQCTGDNINPALEWTNAPEGTVTFAIAMTDESASGWVHWVHANIPADVTTVAQGESASLPGVAGRDQATGQPGYFGPCPPGPNHRYVFTIYALDTELDLEERFSGLDLTLAMSGHILGETAITGMRSGPA
jgi:Raf kinase inhibitor-like YbhB/YbcL family protein